MLAISCLLFAHDASVVAKFEAFKAEYGRKYASALEETIRLDAFAAFVQRVEQTNAADPLNTAEHGITKFADLKKLKENASPKKFS